MVSSDVASPSVDPVPRGDVTSVACPSRALLDHVTSRWGVLVLVGLLQGPKRFSELTASIEGISDKMLSQTLKTFVADGLATRSVSEQPPVRVTYELTDPGAEVARRLAELVEWLEDNIVELQFHQDRNANRR
jgi:DNA-binding HxlR family transcriptional regulator